MYTNNERLIIVYTQVCRTKPGVNVGKFSVTLAPTHRSYRKGGKGKGEGREGKGREGKG